MDPPEAVAWIAERLRADGQQVTSERLPGGVVTVGYRGDFRLSWMATKLNLFTVVLPVGTVTAEDLKRFVDDALQFAVDTKGALRGLQTGAAAIPILVGSTVEPEAAALAQQQIVKRWAAFAWPAAMATQTGETFRHEGRVMIGGLYANWMRGQSDLALGR